MLAHPDDELVVAGTLMAQRRLGDRVVVAFLTRGEATGAFGSGVGPAEVALRRERLAARAADMLDIEHRFLDFPDCGVEATPEAARAVARLVAETGADAMVTWGEAWIKGMRHPDHQAAGKIARDAVTLARIASIIMPMEPHRAFCPVFTVRGAHSRLPLVSVDVEPYLDRIFRLADFYREAIGFGDRDWLEDRLRRAGTAADRDVAEGFDAWETEPGTVASLLPARETRSPSHPPREAVPGS